MNDIHFIRPYWLLAIVALFIAIWLIKRLSVSHSGWTKLIPNHLANVLVEKKQSNKSLFIFLPFIIGLLTIIALAGPTWEKRPQPVYQIERGSVLIMDMSYSMYSTDIKPNRLTRARYKAIDLLDNLNEGDIGLIAYAGDAFTISPLTEDINNIKLLLPSLTPEIMPELGSNPIAALYMAHDMLMNAGHIEGDIYLFTDGIDNEDVIDINNWSKEFPHQLNILGIGTKEGAPITLPNGELLKDDNGAIVIPKLPEGALYGVSKNGRGKYQTITSNMKDIERIVTTSFEREKQNERQSENTNTGDQWQEAGPYLLLLVLPLLLGYFRRGNLLAILPLVIAFNFTVVDSAQADFWDDLWKTKNQQAQQKFNKEQFADAAEQFQDPLWQGSSHYKAGNYQQALDSFKQINSAESLYNQGNALAKLEQLDEAIAAYDEALTLQPEHADAKSNKEILEQLKQQQEQQQQEQEQEQNQEQSSDENNEQKGDQQKNDQQGENQDQENNEQQRDEQQNQEKQQSQDQSQGEQSQQDQQPSDEQAQNSQEQPQPENDKDEQSKAEESKTKEGKEGKEEQSEEQLSPQAQLAKEKLDQEKAQKQQQILNMVTDDPYLLLRNKMQLEYQKRRQNNSQSGVKKKW